MQDTVKNLLNKIMKDKARHRRVVAMLVVLALITSMVTTWAMHLEGEALAKVVACGKESHTHTEECYQKTLTCGQSDTGHVHSQENGCYTYEPVLTCEQVEHTHAEECYDADGNLICETVEHAHDAACYTQELTLNCDISEEPEHVHTDACYTAELVCGKEEHTHDDTCYTDPNADVETADDWKETLPDEKDLNGEWAHDLLAVAESQLDYTESTANWQLGEDGVTHKGYTRYGAWYGVPYGDWCAMYVSFCLNYAGIPTEAIPYNASCPTWVDALKEMELFVAPEADYVPQPGDLVFFDLNAEDGENIAQHAGIVKELDEEHQVLYVYEGNSNDKVQLMAYLLPGYVEPTEEEQKDIPAEEWFHTPEVSLQMADDTLIGYASLTVAEETYHENYPDAGMSGIVDAVDAVDIAGNATGEDDASAEGTVEAQALIANTNSKKVLLRVMINDEWQTVATIKTAGFDTDAGRAYITASQLTACLGDRFGFTGTNIGSQFGHSFVSDQYYAILYAKDSTKCLSYGDGNSVTYPTNNGEQAVGYTATCIYDYKADQSWSIFKIEDAGNGRVFLRNQGDLGANNVINIHGGVSTIQENIDKALGWWTTENNESDISNMWRVEKTANGYYTFHTAWNDNYVIDLDSNVTTNYHRVHLWTTDSVNAEWDLKPIYKVYNDTIASGDRIYLGASETDDFACYYLPDALYNAAGGKFDTQLGTTYSFYTVTVDPGHVTGNTYDVKYVRSGGTFTMTVPSGYSWTVTDADGNLVNSAVSGNTLTVSNVTGPITVAPGNANVGNRINHKVTFKVLIDGQWQTVGTQGFYYCTEGQNDSRAYVTSSQAAQFFGQFGYTATTAPGYRFGHSVVGSDDQYKFILSATNSDYAMGVNSFVNGNGSIISLHSLAKYTGANQMFEFQTRSDGKLAMRAAHTGNQYVNSTENMTQQLYTWENLEDINSGWEQINQGDGTVSFKVARSEYSAYAMDLDSNTIAHGHMIHTWNYDSAGPSQRWKIASTTAIWNNYGDACTSTKIDGSNEYKIFMANTDSNDLICYYLPATDVEHPYCFPDSVGGKIYDYWAFGDNIPKASVLDNGFYSVSIVDSNHAAYTDAEMEALTTYIQKGQSGSVTLKNVAGYVWAAIGQDGSVNAGSVNSTAQTVTFSFSNMSQPWKIILSSANPAYTVGYYADVDVLDTSGNNVKLGVVNTSGRILPSNAANVNGTLSTLNLNLSDSGTIVWNTSLQAIYADNTFSYFSAPESKYIDTLDKNYYTIREFQVSTGGYTKTYSAKTLSFTNDPTKVNDTTVLITDDTYVKIIYDRVTNQTEDISATFYDYDITEGDRFVTVSDSGYWSGKGINRFSGYNADIGTVASSSSRYIFGNVQAQQIGRLDTFDTGTANGQLSNGTVQLEYGFYINSGNGGTSGIENPIKQTAFGLVKSTLEGDTLAFADGILHPEHLFDSVARTGKSVKDSTKLRFIRTGDSYVLSSVMENNDALTDNLQYLVNPQEKYSWIYTNNFWPMDTFPHKDGLEGDGTQGGVWSYDIPGSGTASTSTTQGTILSDDGKAHNWLFGMTTSLPFVLDENYVGPLNYLFYGDDDMWIYLVRKSGTALPNGASSQLIIDIGGIHSSVGEYVNLRDYLPVGSSGEYELRVFYTERGFSGSTCYMQFTLPGVSAPSQAEYTSASITKKVESSDPADSTKDYTFTFKVAETTSGWNEITDRIFPTIRIKADGTEEEGTIKSGGTFTLQANETLIVNGLPIGDNYRVEFGETEPDGMSVTCTGTANKAYDLTWAKGWAFIPNSDSSQNTMEFTNTRLTDASVKKVVSTGNAPSSLLDSEQAFKMQVKLFQGYPGGATSVNWGILSGSYDYTVTDASGNSVTGFQLYNKDSTAKSDSTKIQDGDVFYLKHGWTLTVKNLPATAVVGFYEEAYDKYTTSWAISGTHNLTNSNDLSDLGSGPRYIGDGCVYSLNADASQNLAICTNTMKTTSVSMEKKVVNGGSEKFTFEFVMGVENPGWTQVNASFPCTITGSSDNNGKTSITSGEYITLGNGGKIVVSGVPIGYKAEFWEQAKSDYATSHDDSANKGFEIGSSWPSGNWYKLGVYAKENTSENHMVFTNTRLITITVTKTVNHSGIVGYDANQDYYFQLYTKYQTSSGGFDNYSATTFAGWTYTVTGSGATTGETHTVTAKGVFSLKEGQTATFTGIMPEANKYVYAKELIPTSIAPNYSVTATATGVDNRNYGQGTCTDKKGTGDTGLDEECWSYDSNAVAMSGTANIAFSHTNTLVPGSLSITKQVSAAEAAGGDTSGTFKMDVRINGQPLPEGTQYTVGDATKTVEVDKSDGVVTNSYVSIGHNETALITSLAPGAQFTVTEVDDHNSGYVPTYTVNGTTTASAGSATGTIVTNSTVSVLVNNAQRGTVLDVPVKKVVTNPDGVQRTFQFTLWRWSPTVDTTIPPVVITISNNEAQNVFKLKYLAENFPDGETQYIYRMDEVAGNDTNISYDTGIHYDIFVKITKSSTAFTAEVTDVKLNHDNPSGDAEHPAVAYFTNTLLGNLEISKQAVGVDGNTDFSFSVTLTGQANKAFAASKTDASGTTETTVTTNASGVATITLKQNEKLLIKGIPAGTAWTVEETTTGYNTSYKVNHGNSVTGARVGETIEYGNKDTVEFTNTKLVKLYVGKKIEGSTEGLDSNKDYYFQIRQCDKGTGAYNTALFAGENYKIYTYSDATQTFAETDRTGTVASNGTFTLKANEYACFETLFTEEKDFYVKEIFAAEDNALFDITFTGCGAGAVNGPYDDQHTVPGHTGNNCCYSYDSAHFSMSSDTDTYVTHVVNKVKPQYGTLAITKDLLGSEGADRSFTFQIEMKDKDGKAVDAQFTYTVKKGDQVESENETLTLTNGKGTITIKDDRTLTITNIPQGTVCTVTEENAGYHTTVQVDSEQASEGNSATVTIEADMTSTLLFKNSTGAILPETGGMGTGIYTALGILLMLMPLGVFALYIQSKRKCFK